MTLSNIAPVSTSALAEIVKAYDVRGIYPQQIDATIVRSIGAAFARHCGCAQIVVGRDMRASGEELAAAFINGATAAGTDVINIGLASTDLLYFASGHLNLPGAMLTASHNPAAYNGIKLCGPGATPIGEQSGLPEISQLATAGMPAAKQSGKVASRDLLEQFTQHVHSFVNLDSLAPLKVVADTANAMGGYVLPPVFADLPFRLSLLHPELDGTFPNHPADPLQLENLADLQAAVSTTAADIGLAFDGDADRVFLVDEQAQPVSGSLTTALVAKGVLLREGPGPILHNLICSRAVPEVIAEAGGTPVRTRVGHSYIKAMMAQTGAAFGGEHSGHYYFARNFNADSGLIAALVVLEQLSTATVPLSELLEPLNRYASSGEINLEVADPTATIERVSRHYADPISPGPGQPELGQPELGQPGLAQTGPVSQDRLDGLTVQGSDWWFNLRPSNTEPVLRFNAEAANAAALACRVSEVMSLLDVAKL